MTADMNGWQDEREEEREAAWRGDVHPDEAEDDDQPWAWPEHLAGPEYWLNKKDSGE